MAVLIENGNDFLTQLNKISLPILGMKKIVLFSAVLFASCGKHEPALQKITTCDPNISYSKKVQGIFINNCTNSGCHDGLNYPSLAEYPVARDGADQIKTAVSLDVMPKGATLSDSDKAAILCWIDNGAKDN